jgi:dihydroflavonol-4-reductase
VLAVAHNRTYKLMCLRLLTTAPACGFYNPQALLISKKTKMYLITGCNGLIGSFIARRLLLAGFAVAAIRRADSDLHFIADIASQIRWIEADILDISSLKEAMQGMEYVIHAAALVSFQSRDFAQMRQVNIAGTTNVVNLCLELGVKKLIYISSVAALGATQGLTIDEKTVWDKSDVPSMYAQTKFEAEREVWRGVAEGLTACIINPSVVLGRGDANKSSNQYFGYAWKEPTFYPAGAVSVVDVRDVAEIAYLLLTQAVENQSFIANGHKINYQTFFEKIATYLGKKAPTKEAKTWHLYLAWAGSEVKAWFSGKPSPLSLEIVRNSKRKTTYSSQKVQKELNFRFREIEDTLQWTCEYYKTELGK